MKRPLLTFLTCLGILAAAAGAIFLLFLLKPEPPQEAKTEPLPVVEVLAATAETIQLRLPSQGMVEASRVTQVAAEVAGKVVWVSPNFKAGGRFEPEEDLLRLEEADYRAAVAEAAATLAEAELDLASETAKGDQALRDWQRLGSTGVASDLALRKPHLQSAKARLTAARGALQLAERNLARTRIQAPFAATIDRIRTELGSYLRGGDPVATLLAGAPYEVRLPLSLDDYTLVSAPEGASVAKVWFRIRAGAETYSWEGKILREEGQMERASRSVHLVAAVFPRNGSDRVLQPGLFVQAEVEGRLLRDIFRIPLQAFQGESRLIIIGTGNRVEFREVSVLRREGDVAFVSQGLHSGERVCLTALEVFIDGMEVDPRTVARHPAAGLRE